MEKRFVSVQVEKIKNARVAFQEKNIQHRVIEAEILLDSVLGDAECISMDYSKIVEWRCVLGSFGYNKLAKDFNFFHFQINLFK